MTRTEKLIRKEFKIKTEEDLINLIESKPEDFFMDKFSTSKRTYLKKIKALVASINSDGDSYSDYLSMAASGSMFEGAYTSSAVGYIIQQYRANRKKLVEQIRFFIE